MININENFLKLQDSYLFSTIAKKVAEFQKNNPDKKIIKLGIGDVTLPLAKTVVDAMKKASDDLAKKETFMGYGPEQGYDFLREKIVKEDYENAYNIANKIISTYNSHKEDYYEFIYNLYNKYRNKELGNIKSK